MPQHPLPLDFAPGIQRDGTRLDSLSAVDGRWCRWRLSRPRKMLGYVLLNQPLKGVPRRIHMFYQGSKVYVHVGTSTSLEQIILDRSGNVIGYNDRTPPSFEGGPDVGWTLDSIFDTTSNVVQLVGHAVPDLGPVASDTQTVPFIGQLDAATPLGEFSDPVASSGTYTQPKISGGVVCVQPFVFDFDSNGLVQWSAPNLPNYLGIVGGTTGAGQARISAQKIVAGSPLRGGGANSPAALFWSLSEVITATYIGTPAWFAFNTVSPSSSILSGNGVIEYDGLYYWAATDRFLVYNGTVSEVPNRFCQDFFFDNLNQDFAGKVFAFKVPRFGEIWWCAPMFGATEPNHAVVLNVREQTWYDTPLPDSSRTAGYFAQGFRYPLMGSSNQTNGGYELWMHENGLDKVVNGTPQAIQSYFETPYFGGPRRDPPSNDGYSIQQLEPDIIQVGDLQVSVVGGANVRAGDTQTTSPPVTLPANPSVPQEQFASFKATMRLPRLRVESNQVGGNYVFGKSLIHVDDAKDMRITGGKSASPGGSA